jgi:hypothetical protein
MSRGMAGRLVRRAIQKSIAQAPRGLRTTCVRRGRGAFSCEATWLAKPSRRWSGHVGVWYRLSGDKLDWYYNFRASEKPGGRSIRELSATGSASRFVAPGPDGMLLCRRPDLGG